MLLTFRLESIAPKVPVPCFAQGLCFAGEAAWRIVARKSEYFLRAWPRSSHRGFFVLAERIMWSMLRRADFRLLLVVWSSSLLL